MRVMALDKPFGVFGMFMQESYNDIGGNRRWEVMWVVGRNAHPAAGKHKRQDHVTIGCVSVNYTISPE